MKKKKIAKINQNNQNKTKLTQGGNLRRRGLQLKTLKM